MDSVRVMPGICRKLGAGVVIGNFSSQYHVVA